MMRVSMLADQMVQAAKNGCADGVVALLSRGADIDGVDECSKTPLYWAVRFENINMIKLLVTHGAFINARHEQGLQALHVAAFCGAIEDVNFLVERGADIHGQDDYGRTPLHHAAGGSKLPRKETLRLFLALGADVNASTRSGDTALHFAINWARPGEQRLLTLLEQGANVNARNKNRFTPLDLASGWVNTQAALILIAFGAESKKRPAKVGRLSIAEMVPWQAAIRAGLVSKVAQYLSASATPDQSPNAIVAPSILAMASYAKKVKNFEILALIQSSMAMQVVDELTLAGSSRGVCPP